MASEWLTIDGFGEHGMQPDLMPTKRQSMGALDMAQNCRPVGGNLRLAGGFNARFDLPATGLTLFSQQAWGDMVMYCAGTAGIYRYIDDGTGVWSDITDEPFSLSPIEPNQPCGRWSGGFLMGTLTFNNCGIVRAYYYNAVDALPGTVAPLRYDKNTNDLTWEHFGLSASVMRPWRNFMFAGNITNASVETDTSEAYYPQRVMWSHPCTMPDEDQDNPGEYSLDSAPPERWFPGDPTSLAGNVDLAETSGIIVDLVPLRDQLIIYKSDAIYSVDYTGGASVFRFRHILSNRGISSRDAVVEYNGLHYVQGAEDIFAFDGNTAKSLIWGLVKRFYLLDRDPDKAGNNFTSINPKAEEILFHYSPKSSHYPYPTKALAYCLITGAWTLRDYGLPMQHSLWSRSMGSISGANWELYAIHNYDGVVDLETGTTRAGESIPVEITRTGLGANPGHGWVQVDDAKVGLIADGGQKFKFELGGQSAPSAPVNWRLRFPFDPTTDYSTNARQNANIIAFRLTADVTEQWQLGNIDLLVQKGGRRG